MKVARAEEERAAVERMAERVAVEVRAADAAKSNAKSNPNDARGGDGAGYKGGATMVVARAAAMLHQISCIS